MSEISCLMFLWVHYHHPNPNLSWLAASATENTDSLDLLNEEANVIAYTGVRKL